MPLQGRRVTVAVKIPAPTCLCRTELIAPEKIIQQSLPQPGQFMEAAAMPGIIDRQGEKLEGTLERHAAVLGIVLITPVQGPFDLASDIGELFHQRKFQPAPRGQLSMLNTQDRTLLPTTLRIFSRTAGSSTPRDRWPREGRILIMESNSIRSGPSKSG